MKTLIFEKVPDFLSLLSAVVCYPANRRNNSKEMKELLGYMARHHKDLEKSFTEEQEETFDKFHDCWSEYMRLAEASIFEYAFKLGMQIAIKTLTE